MSEIGDQAAGSVEVAAVVSGRDAMIAIQRRMLLRAYRMRGASNGTMHLTRPSGVYKGTIKGFNEAFGQSCRTWAQVEAAAKTLLSEGA